MNRANFKQKFFTACYEKYCDPANAAAAIAAVAFWLVKCFDYDVLLSYPAWMLCDANCT